MIFRVCIGCGADVVCVDLHEVRVRQIAGVFDGLTKPNLGNFGRANLLDLARSHFSMIFIIKHVDNFSIPVFGAEGFFDSGKQFAVNWDLPGILAPDKPFLHRNPCQRVTTTIASETVPYVLRKVDGEVHAGC